jgi:peptide/nickel transport system permease protein
MGRSQEGQPEGVTGMARTGTRRIGPLARLAGLRVAWGLFTLASSSIIIFVATRVMPGDVAQLILGTYATADSLATLRQQLGLDRPAVVQFADWFGGVVTGHFGKSLRMGIEIGPVLMERLGLSLVLAFLSILLVFVLGVGFGTIAALRQRGLADRLLSSVSLAGISMPEFVTGALLILLFTDVLPVSGYAPISDGFLSWLAHLVLPVASLTLILLAHVMRTARTSMIEVLGSPYIRTAVVKGLPRRSVVLKHALRNALLPTVTVLGINVGYLIGGIVVVETVFAYPGLGRLTIFAVQNRDVPLIQASTLAMATVYIVASMVTDFVYLALNPRLRG